MYGSRSHVSSGSPYEPILGSSRAVQDGGIVSVAGTAPIAPGGGTSSPGNAAGQARRCLEIIGEALSSLGAGFEDVTRTRILLTNIEDWESVARVHGEFLGEARPATTVMQVVRFTDPEWLVELEAEAVPEDG